MTEDRADRDPARLVQVSEAPRVGDWTLRSALVRYAQPAPEAASAVLELVRRTEGALRPHARAIENGGLDAIADAQTDGPSVGELLDVAAVLDELGDELAAWAADRSRPRPDAAVQRLGEQVFARLADLGVPREQRPPRRAG